MIHSKMVENMAKRQENGEIISDNQLDWVEIQNNGDILARWLESDGETDCPDEIKLDFISLTAAKALNMSYISLNDCKDKNELIKTALKCDINNPLRDFCIREFDRIMGFVS